MRLELFFKNLTELQILTTLCRDNGISSVNLTNKQKSDTVLEWLDVCQQNCPSVDVVPHYSLKYQNAPRDRTGNASYDVFKAFCQAAADRGVKEVLVVNGSGPKRPLDTVSCLERAAKDRCRGHPLPISIGCCFNPYFPDPSAVQEERRQLQAKLASGAVSSVWLQFGSNIAALRSGLEFLTTLQPADSSDREGGLKSAVATVQIVGSVFLPTKALLARMRFRPWNGVFLSEEYLSDVQAAHRITQQLLEVYREFNVEPLVESSVKSDKDMRLLREVLGDLASGS